MHVKRWHGNRPKPRGQPSLLSRPSSTTIRHQHGRRTKLVFQIQKGYRAPIGEEQSQGRQTSSWWTRGGRRLIELAPTAGTSCLDGRRSRTSRRRTQRRERRGQSGRCDRWEQTGLEVYCIVLGQIGAPRGERFSGCLRAAQVCRWRALLHPGKLRGTVLSLTGYR